jgi:hypothetical protein
LAQQVGAYVQSLLLGMPNDAVYSIQHDCCMFAVSLLASVLRLVNMHAQHLLLCAAKPINIT